MNRVLKELKPLGRDIVSTTVSLFKIMIPMLILIRVAETYGGVVFISELLEPFMTLLGLPGSMALVWATTLLTNIYGGIVVLVNTDVALTVAQVTVLSSLLLVCHTLPIESMISKKAGIPFFITTLLRVGGGFLFAWLQSVYYATTETGQELAEILWQNDATVYESHLDWAIGQTGNLLTVFIVIALLLTLLRILKLLKIEQVMSMLMMPLLKILQVSKDAANLAVIGITLGLSYGGGLIINEAQKGTLAVKDVLMTILLLNLLHSIIEDTALVMLLGAEFNMVFWGRIVFSVLVVAVISHAYSAVEKARAKSVTALTD